MNKLLSHVKDLLAKAFPRPITLLAQHKKAGDDLLRSMAAHGVPVLNVKARGVEDYIKEVWRSVHITSPNAPADLVTCIAVMQHVLTRTKDSHLYRSGTKVEWETAVIHASVLNTLNEEGITPDHLKANGLDALATVYHEYLLALNKTGLLLPAQMVNQIPKQESSAVYAIPSNTPLSAAERVFLEKIGKVETVPVPVPDGEDKLPRRMYDPSGVKEPWSWPTKLACYNAQTSETEYQGIVRIMLRDEIRAEDTAVLCYSQEQSDRICENAEAIGIECTTAFGRPMQNAAALTVLKALLDWSRDHYDLKQLSSVLESNMLNWYDATGTQLASGKNMLKALRKKGIGWEKDLYDRLSLPESGETAWEQKARECARELCLGWIDLLEKRHANPVDTGKSIIRLLASCIYKQYGTRSGLEFQSLAETITTLSKATGEDIRPTDFLDTVYQAALNSTYDNGSDEPGKLYICRYWEALTLNRSVFFIPGMVMKAFDKPAGESPVIPDRIREKLSKHIPQSRDEAQARRYALKELLITRNEDRFILSWAQRDQLTGDKNNPSILFRAAAKVATPKNLDILGDTVMNETDCRLRLGQASLNPLPGSATISTASLDRLTSNLVLSVSELDTLCACVRKFFLRSILKITPPDDLPDQYAGEWLDSRTAGTFLHNVMRQYMEELTKSGVAVREDPTLLETCYAQQLHALETTIPLPVNCSPTRRARQIERLFQMANTIAQKYRDDKDHQFICAEMAFKATPIPMTFGAYTVNVKGQIDRIDYNANTDKYEIIDYKTSDPKKFNADESYQVYLYVLAWESLNPGKEVSCGHYYLLDRGSGGLDEIVLADKEVNLSSLERAKKEAFIANMLSKLKDPETCCEKASNKDSCKYCEYQQFCKEVK